ncbi:unnamed protein product [Effrenium voratum]|uniref:Uncharacterized protein n=1 Tax=Effrenium voratum TaxID=2562239 RepID=A0AA36HLL3_9DINO|nr:unnamed protein product [Effrenium voratum]
MECRLRSTGDFIIIPDPFTTPGTHVATYACFYAISGTMLICMLVVIWLLSRSLEKGNQIHVHWASLCRRPFLSDAFYLGFFFLGFLGFAFLAAAAQTQPAGDNGVMLVAEILQCLSWMCLLLNSCCILEQLQVRRAGRVSMWLACLLVLLLAVLDLAMSLGPHFIGTASLSSLSAALCVPAFTLAHEETKTAAPAFKAGLCFMYFTSYLVIAALEPFCGYAAHPTCYSLCNLGSPGAHVAVATPLLLLAGPFLCFMQTTNPDQASGPRIKPVPPDAPASDPDPDPEPEPTGRDEET